MKPTFTIGNLFFACISFWFVPSITAQTTIGTFSPVTPGGQPNTLMIPATHTFQRIIKTGDALSMGGTLGINSDFTGYVPIAGSSTNGRLSINSENTPAEVAILDINYSTATHTWVVTAGGKVSFPVNDLGDVSRFCSGTVTPNGTIMVGEETTVAGNANSGFDSYEDLGWIIEIDPVTRTVINQDGAGPVDKLWAAGRQSHENIAVKSNNTAIYRGADANPTGYMYKFVPTVPGNWSSGLLYVLDAPGLAGNGTGRSNPFDIDSDNDGIPDNVEGLTTLGYLLPAAADTDVDGIDIRYDNFNGFGGDGIHPVDTDSDTTPDYLDNDTDSDGMIDIIEGNDLNLNGLPDDLVTLTGVDTDNDGLDDRFDNNNSSAEATSAYMGNGGTTSGDPIPGSITTVQHTATNFGCPSERDWRCIPYILNCNIITYKATLQNQETLLDWSVLCKQEARYFIVERSEDRINFAVVANINVRPVIDEVELYTAADNIAAVTAEIMYYRLKTILRNGSSSYSKIIVVRQDNTDSPAMQIMPNPVKDRLQVLIIAKSPGNASISIVDAGGRVIQVYSENLRTGPNTFTYSKVACLPPGVYYLRLKMDAVIVNRAFRVIK